MPNLLFRGVEADKLRRIGEPLAAELADICGCGADNFTMDVMLTATVYGGLDGRSYPFVEIGWFERGQSVRDRVAEAVAGQLRSIGVEECEMVFRAYREDHYYINGKPCG
jgi:Domain of unknown function (DUF1904).